MTNYNMLLVAPWTSITENPKYIPQNDMCMLSQCEFCHAASTNLLRFPLYCLCHIPDNFLPILMALFRKERVENDA